MIPQCPGSGRSRSTCSRGHSTKVGAQFCRLLLIHHQTKDSAKPGLTYLPEGVALGLLPKGTTSQTILRA